MNRSALAGRPRAPGRRLALPGCLALPGDLDLDAAADARSRMPSGPAPAALPGCPPTRPGHRPRRRRPPGGPLVGGLHAACPAAPGAGEAPPDNGTLRRALPEAYAGDLDCDGDADACCCWTPRTPSARPEGRAPGPGTRGPRGRAACSGTWAARRTRTTSGSFWPTIWPVASPTACWICWSWPSRRRAPWTGA
ncbi:MAG: hypothetical protein R3F43_09160 [bacterium]